MFGEADKNIPAAAQHFMAERAKAEVIVAIDGGRHAISHAVFASHRTRSQRSSCAPEPDRRPAGRQADGSVWGASV